MWSCGVWSLRILKEKLSREILTVKSEEQYLIEFTLDRDIVTALKYQIPHLNDVAVQHKQSHHHWLHFDPFQNSVSKVQRLDLSRGD